MRFNIATLEDVPDLVKLRIQFLKEVDLVEDDCKENKLEIELEQYFNSHIEKGDFINWLAIDQGKIVATGGICFNYYPPSFTSLSAKRAYIMNIYTLPDYRNQGLAEKILGYLMKEAANANIDTVTLHATAMGLKLYQKFGFKSKNSEMVFSRELHF